MKCTVRDTTCPAFHSEYNRLKKFISKVAKENNWTVVSCTMGHYFVSGFLRDSNGNYVYFSKQDWDSVSNVKWLRNEILVRTAKSRKDYTGGNNGYATLFQKNANFESVVEMLFRKQPVKMAKKIVCKRHRRNIK